MGGERKDRGGHPFSQWERGSRRLGELVGVSSIPVCPTEPWARRSHGNVGVGVPRDAPGLGVDSELCPSGLEQLSIPWAFHGERRVKLGHPTVLSRGRRLEDEGVLLRIPDPALPLHTLCRPLGSWELDHQEGKSSCLE